MSDIHTDLGQTFLINRDCVIIKDSSKVSIALDSLNSCIFSILLNPWGTNSENIRFKNHL